MKKKKLKIYLKHLCMLLTAEDTETEITLHRNSRQLYAQLQAQKKMHSPESVQIVL